MTKAQRSRPSAEAVAAAAAARRKVASTKVAVTETVKFAGQDTTVTKYVNSMAEATKGKGTNLSELVSTLGKGKSISTVEKSSRDWDTYKVQEGIEDEVGQYTKDGYLERQDFLQRVDHRTFENERKARILDRAAREAGGPSK